MIHSLSAILPAQSALPETSGPPSLTSPSEKLQKERQRVRHSSLQESLPQHDGHEFKEAVTPKAIRRQKLRRAMLLERKKMEGQTSAGFQKRSRFRGLGRNVSLFSPEYRDHLFGGQTLKSEDLEAQAAENNLRDPLATREEHEEYDFFSAFDESRPQVRLRNVAKKKIESFESGALDFVAKLQEPAFLAFLSDPIHNQQTYFDVLRLKLCRLRSNAARLRP